MLVLIIILKILVSLLLIILGLLLLFLLIPFNYSGRVIAADEFKAELAVGWAWKLLGINAELEGEAVDITLRVFDKRVYRFKGNNAVEKEEPAEEKPQEQEKQKKQGKGFSIRDITDKALIHEVLDYFRRVLNIAKPKYMHLYGTYGFDDPSLTGMVCGLTGIIKGIIPHARLRLNPDFTQEILDLDLRAEGSMVVGNLAFQTLRTVMKKPVRKILFKKKKN